MKTIFLVRIGHVYILDDNYNTRLSSFCLWKELQPFKNKKAKIKQQEMIFFLALSGKPLDGLA